MLTFIAGALSGKILKGLVAIWTKDQEYLKLASDVALEKIQKQAGGYLEARKLTRLLGQIEDEILESLASHLESEYRNVSKGDRAILAASAVDIISTPEFYNACFEEAFDLRRLADRYEQNFVNAARELSIVDYHAAVNIGRFALAKYLAVLSGLPRFSADTLRFILSDTDEILERVRNVEVLLEQCVVRDRKAYDGNESQYRRLLAGKLRKIDIFGVDSRSLTKRYNLSIAYITLTLSTPDGTTSGEAAEVIRDAIAEDGRLIIVSGDPGSGKTTLLSWLALECAESRISSSIPSLDGHLPIFLSLRQYASKDLPKGADLLNAYFSANAFPDNWARERISGGRLVFFLDGFDEVPEAKRGYVVEWLEELIESSPGSHFFVSTRPYAAIELAEVSRRHGVVEPIVSVEPMSPNQVDAFITGWYAAYSQEVTSGDISDRLAAAKVRLLERVIGNSSLRSLIRNPLLCSLICFVNADRDGFVPDHRGELYSLATETLLDRRDRERGIDHGSDLTLARKQKILGYISEYFFKRKGTQLDKDDVTVAIREYLPALGMRPDDARAVLDTLCDRSHVLRAPVEGEVEFSHKTFLEYFYARRIVDQGLIEVTRDAVFMEDSREVFLFVFSLAGQVLIRKILASILPIVEGLESWDPEKKRAILLLQSAINQAAEVDPSQRKRTISLLSQVLPPKNLDDAEKLALAGEVILEPLKAFANEAHRSFWKNSVHAILNTFCDDAIYALVPYARLRDSGIDKILVAGRRFYDGGTYRDVVIKECTTISTLVVRDFHDLELVSTLPMLETVHIRQYGDRWDDVQLPAAAGIRELEIFDAYAVDDLSVLSIFPNIETLAISGCDQIHDFSEVGRCRFLRNVSIVSGSIDDLSFLADLKHLDSLDLSECPGIRDVRPLNNCATLKKLVLPYSHLYDQITIDYDTDDIEIDVDFYDDSGPSEDELRFFQSTSNGV